MKNTNIVSIFLFIKYDLALFQYFKTNNKKQVYKDYIRNIYHLFLIGSLLFII